MDRKNWSSKRKRRFYIVRIIIALWAFLVFETTRRPLTFKKDTLTSAKLASDRIQSQKIYIKNTKIPKVIHQTWKTKNMWSRDVPIHVRQSVQSWRQCAPDFEYLLWDDHDMELMVRRLFPRLYPFYASLPKIVMKSDLFRLLALIAFGGIVSWLCIKA
jgi:mannosyltransferase OCH1-like enzyme